MLITPTTIRPEVSDAAKTAAKELLENGHHYDWLPAIEDVLASRLTSIEGITAWDYMTQVSSALEFHETQAKLPKDCQWYQNATTVRTYHPNSIFSRLIREGIRNAVRFSVLDVNSIAGVFYDLLQEDILRRHDLPSLVKATEDSLRNSGVPLWERNIPMASWILEGDGQTTRVLNGTSIMDVASKERNFVINRVLAVIRGLKSYDCRARAVALNLEATRRGMGVKKAHPFFSKRMDIYLKNHHDKGGNPNGYRSIRELIKDLEGIKSEFPEFEVLIKRLKVHGFHLTEKHVRFPSKLIRHLAEELASRMGVGGVGFKALCQEDHHLPDVEVLETLEDSPQWLLECLLGYAHAHAASGGFKIFIVSNTQSEKDFWVARWLTKMVGLDHLNIALLMEDDEALSHAGEFAETFKHRDDYISMFAYSDTSRGSSYTAAFLLWKAVQDTVQKGEGKIPLYFGWSAISNGRPGFGEPFRGSHTVLPNLGDTRKVYQTMQGQNFKYFAITGDMLEKNLARSKIPVSPKDPVGENPELLSALLKWHRHSAKAFQELVFSSPFRKVLSKTMIARTGEILHSLRATAKSDGAGAELNEMTWDKTRAINTVVTGCLIGMPFQLYGVATGWKNLTDDEKKLIQSDFARSPFLTNWLEGLMIGLSRYDHGIFSRYCKLAKQNDVATLVMGEMRGLKTVCRSFPSGVSEMADDPTVSDLRSRLIALIEGGDGVLPEPFIGNAENPLHRQWRVTAVAIMTSLRTFG